MSIPFDPALWRKRRVRSGARASSHCFSEAVDYRDAEKGIRCADRQLPQMWVGEPGQEVFIEPEDVSILWATPDEGKTFVLLYLEEVKEISA